MSNQDRSMEEMLLPVFVEESFHAHDESGTFRIPAEQRELLTKVLGLPMAKVAVYAWLAERLAETEYEDMEFDSMSDSGGGSL